MLTPDEETNLITAAQDGDAEASIRLVQEYRPNIAAIVHQYDSFDPAEFEAELNAQLWQAIRNFNPARGSRLWGLFSRYGVPAAVNSMHTQQLPVTGDGLTYILERVREVERRMRDQGETLEQAAAYAQIAATTVTEVQAMRRGATEVEAENYTERTPEESVAMAEVALDALTGLQHFLTVRKYGFEKDPSTGEYVTLPRQYVNTGRPDAEVADYYNQTAADDKPLTQTGADTLSRATVQREIVTGHVAARAAINEWFNGGVA